MRRRGPDLDSAAASVDDQRRLALWLPLVGVGGCAGLARGRPVGVIDVRDHGAKGDGKSNDTQSLQSALNACAKQGGGTVVVSPGTYVAAGLMMGSNTTLHLAAGAVISGSHQIDDYPEWQDPHNGTRRRQGLISAVGARNISIEGSGALDGQSMASRTLDYSYAGNDFDAKRSRQGAAFMSEKVFVDGPSKKGPPRPGNVIYFYDCQNVRLRDITVRNSATWHIHMARCQRVWVSGLDVNSRDLQLKLPNDDGMDFTDCESVRISDCHIETGDDCLVFLGSRGVTVNNCWLKSRSTAVRVGYDGTAKMQSCHFTNLVIKDSNRGLGVFARSAGDIEDISFRNCSVETRLFTGRWWGKGEPIHVSCMPWEPGATRLGRIRGLRFDNIVARSSAGVVIWGQAASPIEDLQISNLDLQLQSDPLHERYGGNFDLRLTNKTETNLFKHDIPGLFACHVRDLTLRDVRVGWPDKAPNFCTSAIDIEDFQRVRIEGFSGKSAQRAHPVIRLTRGETVRLHGGDLSTNEVDVVEAIDVDFRP